MVIICTKRSLRHVLNISDMGFHFPSFNHYIGTLSRLLSIILQYEYHNIHFYCFVSLEVIFNHLFSSLCKKGDE